MIPIIREILDPIASSFEYPSENNQRAAREAAAALVDRDPAASVAFGTLARWLQDTPRTEAEERYTALFDLQPSCTLHVGYHVYGEAYQRGALLAGLVGEMRRAGVDLGTELPDFLPTVLRMLSRVPDDEDRQLFIDRIVRVALAQIRRELCAIKTPWAAALTVLADLFEAPAPVEHTLDGLISREAPTDA